MDDRIAIADASVPAGEYVRQALTAAGQIETLSELFVGQDDAGSTLRAVTLGQAKVGFVYASDARSAEFRILFRLDPKTHDPIRYWACAIQGEDPSPAASQFLTGLRTQAVQDVLRRHGFAPVN
jgi:molybdate transport system substrate-binding protein